MHTTLRRTGIVIAAAVGVGILGVTVQSAVNNTIAEGVMSDSEFVDGPAAVRMRTLTIAPGEVLGWHHHPGIGAITIVKEGTLIVEDGCGFETTYGAGDAFLEPPGRVHRGRNPDLAQQVITAQTFVVPIGTEFSVSTPQRCGQPLSVAECRKGGWTLFDHPRQFGSQGDCEQFVITGR